MLGWTEKNGWGVRGAKPPEKKFAISYNERDFA